jgi:arylsulfatase A-like enzyme
LYHPDDVVLPEREPNDFSEKPVSQWVMSHLMALDEKDEHDLRTLIARYYAAISFIDSCIGQVLDIVHNTSLAENTLIVFISDHGDFLGEHSSVEKGPALYDSLIHVPLLFSWPGHIQPQLVRETLVESIDLFPTILDYLGLNTPRGCQGRSLKPLLDGKSNQHKDTVYGFISLGAQQHSFSREDAANIVVRRLAEYDQNPHCRVFRWITPERNASLGVMIRTQDWKLIHYVSGDGELYNLQDDPAEFHNLYGKSEYLETEQALRNQLLDFLIGSFDKRPPLGFDPTLHAKGTVRP